MNSSALSTVYREAIDQLPGMKASIIDHGCGGGSSRSLRMLAQRPIRVVGVDRCSQAISSAKTAYPNIDFIHIRDRRIDLEEGTMDGAFSGFCLNEAPTFEVLKSTGEEIYRVLKPGAKLVVLTLNPDSIGLQFPGHRTEAPQGRHNGAPVFSTELRSGRRYQDFYWDEAVYRSVLSDSGFTDLSVSRATDATEVVPFMILSARKC